MSVKSTSRKRLCFVRRTKYGNTNEYTKPAFARRFEIARMCDVERAIILENACCVVSMKRIERKHQ